MKIFSDFLLYKRNIFSRSQGQKLRSQWKGLVVRSTYMKYDSPIINDSRHMANVKVFADKQTEGWIDKPKTICPIFQYGGIKIVYRTDKLLAFEGHC
jgi:hypothetical protein